jgi:hypothetical protein
MNRISFSFIKESMSTNQNKDQNKYKDNTPQKSNWADEDDEDMFLPENVKKNIETLKKQLSSSLQKEKTHKVQSDKK